MNGTPSHELKKCNPIEQRLTKNSDDPANFADFERHDELVNLRLLVASTPRPQSWMD